MMQQIMLHAPFVSTSTQAHTTPEVLSFHLLLQLQLFICSCRCLLYFYFTVIVVNSLVIRSIIYIYIITFVRCQQLFIWILLNYLLYSILYLFIEYILYSSIDFSIHSIGYNNILTKIVHCIKIICTAVLFQERSIVKHLEVRTGERNEVQERT